MGLIDSPPSAYYSRPAQPARLSLLEGVKPTSLGDGFQPGGSLQTITREDPVAAERIESGISRRPWTAVEVENDAPRTSNGDRIGVLRRAVVQGLGYGLGACEVQSGGR